MAADSPSSSWHTWLLNFLCTGRTSDDINILKVINKNSSDSLRQLSDGDVVINASFSKDVLKKLQNFYRTSDVATQENLALQLQKFTLNHAVHKQMEKCEFRLHVDSCELLQMDLSFLSDDEAQNCMMIASVRRKSKDLWKKSEIKNSDTCADDNLTSSQLVRCLEEDSSDLPDQGGYIVQVVVSVDVPPKEPVMSDNQTVPQVQVQSPVQRTTSDEEYFTPKSSPLGTLASKTRPRMCATIELSKKQLLPQDFIIPQEQARQLAVLPDWRLQAQYGITQETQQGKQLNSSRFASPRQSVIMPGLNVPHFQSESRTGKSHLGQSIRRSLAYSPGKHQASTSHDVAHRPVFSHVNLPNSGHNAAQPSTSNTATYMALGPVCGAGKQFTFKKPTTQQISGNLRKLPEPANVSSFGDTTLAGLGDDFSDEQSQNDVSAHHGKHRSLGKPSTSASAGPKTKTSMHTEGSRPRWLTSKAMQVEDTQGTNDDAESLVLSMDDRDFLSQLSDIPFSMYSQSQRTDKEKTPGHPSLQPTSSQNTSQEVALTVEGSTQDVMVSTAPGDVVELPSSQDLEHTPHDVGTGFHLSVPDIGDTSENDADRARQIMQNEQSIILADSSVQDNELVLPTPEKPADSSARLDVWTCQSQSQSQRSPGSPELDEFDLQLLRIASEQVQTQANKNVDAEASPSISNTQDGQILSSSSQDDALPPSATYFQTYTQWLNAQSQLQGTAETGFDPNIRDSNKGTQPSQEVTHSTQIPGNDNDQHCLLPDLNLSPVRCHSSNYVRNQRMSSSPKLRSEVTAHVPSKKTSVHSENDTSDEEQENSCSLLQNKSKRSEHSRTSARSPDLLDVLEDDNKNTTLTTEKPKTMSPKQTSKRLPHTVDDQMSRSETNHDKVNPPDVSVLFPAVRKPVNVGGPKGKRKLFNMDTVLEEGHSDINTEPVSDEQLFDTDDDCVEVPKHKKLKLDDTHKKSELPDHRELSQCSGISSVHLCTTGTAGSNSRQALNISVICKERSRRTQTAGKARVIKGFLAGKEQVFNVPLKLRVKPIFVPRAEPEPPKTDSVHQPYSGSSTSSPESSVLIPGSIPTPVNSFPANQRAINDMLVEEAGTLLDMVPTMDKLDEQTGSMAESSLNAHSPLGDSSFVIQGLQNYLVKENLVPDQENPLHKLSFPGTVRKFITSYFTRKEKT